MTPSEPLDSGNNARVFIIDDDEMIAVALYEYLVRRGVSVDRAVEPQPAIEALRGARYGVVIVDAYLTGQLHERPAEFLLAIRTLQPSAHIVVLTAYGKDDVRGALQDRDTVTIVEKPQSVASIAAIVDRLVTPPAAQHA